MFYWYNLSKLNPKAQIKYLGLVILYLRYRVLSILLVLSGLLVYSTLTVSKNVSDLRPNEAFNEFQHFRVRRSAGGDGPLATDSEGNVCKTNASMEIEGTNATSCCSHPAYKEFPGDGLTKDQREGGAIIIHVILVRIKRIIDRRLNGNI